MEYKVMDFEEKCNRITGAMLWVATYGVFILLGTGVVLTILE